MPQICVQEGCPRAALKELVNDPAIAFCRDCGNRLQPITGKGPIPKQAPKGPRIVAFLLDAVISLLLGVIALVPVVGQLIGGLLLTVFWLFRDVNGASPGKMILGLVVADRSGGPSTVKQRIIRNVPFAISIAPLIVPIVGYEIAGVLEFLAIVIEVLMVLFTGDRLTDRLVGTKVIKRSDLID